MRLRNRASVMGRTAKHGQIYVGIGGWTFEPWRGVFYPEGLTQKRELEYRQPRADLDRDQRHLLFDASSRRAGPNGARKRRTGFVFSVKASRYCTNRASWPSAGESIDALHRPGLGRAAATGWGRSTGNSWAPRNSMPRISKAFLKLLPREVGRPAAAPCAGSAQRELQGRAILRSRAQVQGRRSSLPTTTDFPEIDEPTGGFHLCAADAQPGG